MGPSKDEEIAEAIALLIILELGARPVETGQVSTVRDAFARIRSRVSRRARRRSSRR